MKTQLTFALMSTVLTTAKKEELSHRSKVFENATRWN
jgi:hypothetical protein